MQPTTPARRRLRPRIVVVGAVAIILAATWAAGGFERAPVETGSGQRLVRTSAFAVRDVRVVEVRPFDRDESTLVEDGVPPIQVAVVEFEYRSEPPAGRGGVPVDQGVTFLVGDRVLQIDDPIEFARTDELEADPPRAAPTSTDAPPGLWVPMTAFVPVDAEQAPLERLQLLAYDVGFRDHDTAFAGIHAWRATRRAARLELELPS